MVLSCWGGPKLHSSTGGTMPKRCIPEPRHCEVGWPLCSLQHTRYSCTAGWAEWGQTEMGASVGSNPGSLAKLLSCALTVLLGTSIFLLEYEFIRDWHIKRCQFCLQRNRTAANEQPETRREERSMIISCPTWKRLIHIPSRRHERLITGKSNQIFHCYYFFCQVFATNNFSSCPLYVNGCCWCPQTLCLLRWCWRWPLVVSQARMGN